MFSCDIKRIAWESESWLANAGSGWVAMFGEDICWGVVARLIADAVLSSTGGNSAANGGSSLPGGYNFSLKRDRQAVTAIGLMGPLATAPFGVSLRLLRREELEGEP